ncbi:hypothetical protein FFWV33_05210 [Flavobacterium faecale]|uniref:Lipoprotein n=1 Tax=Flavobacterium faecale TaxID=1355330 RepID=A0A2S1LIM2_9FLAO|nr:hypothetical protein FFWV33_05210 [Flavobacterium faecale]
MRIQKISILLAIMPFVFSSCASGYKKIVPETLAYNSQSTANDITLEYKYGLLDKKYFRKEKKSGLKLVALKITNKSNQDFVFDNNIRLSYDNGTICNITDNEYVFKLMKQSPASHLLYLLLSPMQLYTTKSNGYGQQVNNNSFPIGLIIGPGLTLGNLITASTANGKFKRELENYNIIGKTIKKGETIYGLVGIKSNNFDALQLKVN